VSWQLLRRESGRAWLYYHRDGTINEEQTGMYHDGRLVSVEPDGEGEDG